MLIFLLLSCLKPVEIKQNIPASDPKIIIEPEYPNLISPVEPSATNPFDVRVEEGPGPFQYLSKIEVVPNVQTIESSPKDLEVVVTGLDPDTPLAVGDSIWWYFSAEMQENEIETTTERGEWDWHSPTLLEFIPESKENEVETPNLEVLSKAGTTVQIAERKWSFEAPLLKESFFSPERQKLVLCFQSPVSIEHLRKTLTISNPYTKPRSPTFLPINADEQETCGERNAIGVHWGISDQSLVYSEDATEWYSSSLNAEGLEITCRDQPCLPNSPIRIYGASNANTEPILKTSPRWAQQSLKKTRYGWEMNGNKPIGKNTLTVSMDGKSNKDDILIVKPTAEIHLHNSIIVPENQTMQVPGKGLWTLSLHPVQQKDWPTFVRNPDEIVLAPAIKTATVNAVEKLVFNVPGTEDNYLARFESGDQTHLAWLLPEDLNVTVLDGSIESVVVVENDGGPIENAKCHYENGSQHSNTYGEIRVKNNKLTPEAWVEWRNVWSPIPNDKTESAPKKPAPWSVYLSKNIIKPTETLKIIGWAPKANSEINWSVSSNERLDILSGQHVSGPDSEVEVFIPIPRNLPDSEYQLRVTQKDQHVIKYFAVEGDKTTFDIEHQWENGELVLRLNSEPLPDVPAKWSIEAKTKSEWEPIGTYWVPSTARIRIQNPDRDWIGLKVTIGDFFDVIENTSPTNENHHRKVRVNPTVLRQFSPVSLAFDSSNVNCDDQKWFVSNKNDLLCSAVTTETCTFQALETGSFELKIHCLMDGIDTQLEGFETTVFGARNSEARIMEHEGEVFVQARSSKADLHVYTSDNGNWKARPHAITNGHLVLSAPADQNAHFFLWDEAGGTQQRFMAQKEKELTLAQDGSTIILKGLEPSQSAVLLNANPTQTVLSNLQFASGSELSWSPGELIKTPTPIKAVTKAMESNTLWFYPGPKAEPELHAPKQLRLGEKSRVEISVYNPSKETKKVIYRLTGPKEMGLKTPEPGQIDLKPMTDHLVQIPVEAMGYGQHELILDTQIDNQTQQTTAQIEVTIASTDHIKETEYHVELGNHGRYTSHDLPASNRPISFSTNIRPTLELAQAARKYSSLPPTPNGKAQKVWIANALWENLSHAGVPERLTLLYQATESLLTPSTEMNATDQILWDAGLVLSLHNGVTPAMGSLVESLERMPRPIPEHLPPSVQHTLEAMQYWTISMANTSVYRGLAAPPDKDLRNTYQSGKWKDYPVIAQSMLLCAASELKDVSFRNDILQYWSENLDRLTAPLPMEIRAHFGWEAGAGNASVIWALTKIAPRSPVLQKVKLNQKQTLNGFWDVLAHSAQKITPKANLQPTLLDQQMLIKKGRYHPYETVPIHYQTTLSEPTTWQVLMFGRGRQYYTLTSFTEGPQKHVFAGALVNVGIVSLNTDENCNEDCILDQHKTYRIETRLDGLERNKEYTVHLPNVSGLNTTQPEVVGGSTRQVQDEWITFKALGPTVVINQITEARHVGVYRVLPFRIYETSNSKFVGSSATTEWTIR